MIIIYQPLREWSFYFTTHMFLSSLQFVLRLCTTLRSSEELIRWFLKNRLIFSFKKDLRMISTPCWKVFCHISTENKRWYWQLYFGLKLTIVFLLCLQMALCIISYLVMANTFITNVIYMTTPVSRRLNILCIMFKILYNNAVHPVSYTWGLAFWKTPIWPHYFTKRGGLGP